MSGKFWRLAAVLLPTCLLTAQHPQAGQPTRIRLLPQPSVQTLKHAAELREKMRVQAVAINGLAGHIQSPEDARKLVDLVATEFSDELPPKWATRSLRKRIARAEYESAADPRSLIPEQQVADAWNDILQKIGAPQETYVTAAEIHSLRDSQYVSSQFFWARGNQTVWSVPNIYAVGPDGKVANGCRALEALNILWQLANQPEILEGTRELIKKGERTSDLYPNPSKPPKPGTETRRMIARMMPPNPVQQAAFRFEREHGMRALDRAVEGLFKDLFAD